jgi:hypothetical protein
MKWKNTHRCWLDEIDHIWMTDFPPPAGFTGYQSRLYDEDDPNEPYTRGCTEEEVAILTADVARSRAAERAEDETLRDEWFKPLKDEAGAIRRRKRDMQSEHGIAPGEKHGPLAVADCMSHRGRCRARRAAGRPAPGQGRGAG